MFADFEYFQETSIGEKINYFEYYMDVYEQYYLNNILELIANIFVLIIGIRYLLSVSVVTNNCDFCIRDNFTDNTNNFRKNNQHYG